jgi:hypothetical protein
MFSRPPNTKKVNEAFGMPSVYTYVCVYVCMYVHALLAPERLDGYYLHPEFKRLSRIAHWSVNL